MLLEVLNLVKIGNVDSFVIKQLKDVAIVSNGYLNQTCISLVITLFGVAPHLGVLFDTANLNKVLWLESVVVLIRFALVLLKVVSQVDVIELLEVLVLVIDLLVIMLFLIDLWKQSVRQHVTVVDHH